MQKLVIVIETGCVSNYCNENYKRILLVLLNTVHKLQNNKEILLWYENELHRVKLPKALAWDMWGALFYVGTIFTTIGYGNIVPRTVAGRALSVVYAIIGIPLVLAILSRSGLSLTTWVSRAWQRYRRHIKQASVKAKKCLRMAQRSQISVQHLEDGKLDVMKLDEIEEYEIDQKPESKTIPIWLALLTCISWICACAGLFMIWEKQWTFFTSLYFFFISLSTIGLDQNRRMAIYFNGKNTGLVIKSFQVYIKYAIREVKYFLILNIENIALNSINFAGFSISGGKFSEKIVEENGSCRMCSKKYEDLLVKSLNLPNNGMDRFDEQVQTDIAQFQIDEIVLRLAALQTQRIRPSFIERSMETSIIGPYKDHTRSDSISQKNETEKNLKDMTVSALRYMFLIVVSSLEWCIPFYRCLLDVYKDVHLNIMYLSFQDKEILTEMLNVMTQSMETDAAIGKKMADHAINTTQIFSNTCGTETSPVSHRTQSVETDPNVITTTSMETDKATLVEKSVETSRSEQLDNCTQISWTEKAKRDIITSPIVQKLIGGPFWKSPTASSIENNDQSIQTVFDETNVELPQKSQYIDRSLQTSMDDLVFFNQNTYLKIEPLNFLVTMVSTIILFILQNFEGSISCYQQPSIGINSSNSDENIDRSLQTLYHSGIDRSFQTSRQGSTEKTMRSSQTSHHEGVDQSIETNRVVVMSRSMETGHWEPMLETNSSKGEKWKKPSSSLYDGIKMNDSVEISTQYSPPMTRSVTKEPRGSSLGVTFPGFRDFGKAGYFPGFGESGVPGYQP
uniref:Ion_trans_2 domain-containing protein n=1 Tax=Heterorhabditis bacteriophora TaxID=37862 RepID=A0A1I7X1A5_HETBA